MNHVMNESDCKKGDDTNHLKPLESLQIDLIFSTIRTFLIHCQPFWDNIHELHDNRLKGESCK